MRILLCVCAVWAFASVGLAQQPVGPSGKAHACSAAQAKSTALVSFPGRVDQEPLLVHESDGWVYIVTVVQDKASRRVWVDADNGRVIGFETNGVFTKGVVAKSLKKLQRAGKKSKAHRKPKPKTVRRVVRFGPKRRRIVIRSR